MPNICRLYLGFVAPLFKPASIGGTPVRVRAMCLADYDEVRAPWLSCAGMSLKDVDDTRDGIARLLAENPTTCLVSFRRNATSNAFWGRMGFSERLDITYRDRALRDIVRFDTQARRADSRERPSAATGAMTGR